MAHASSAQGNHVAFPECQEIAQLYLCPLPNSVQGDFKPKGSPFLLPSPGPEGGMDTCPPMALPPRALCVLPTVLSLMPAYAYTLPVPTLLAAPSSPSPPPPPPSSLFLLSRSWTFPLSW